MRAGKRPFTTDPEMRSGLPNPPESQVAKDMAPTRLTVQPENWGRMTHDRRSERPVREPPAGRETLRPSAPHPSPHKRNDAGLTEPMAKIRTTYLRQSVRHIRPRPLLYWLGTCLTTILLLICTDLFLTTDPLFGENGSAGRIIRKDLDQDGQVDQVAHYDAKGKLRLLEVDSNGNGIMDRFQHYNGPDMTRVEGDLDDDGRIDIKDFYENGRRHRQERLDQNGNVRQMAIFDDADTPLRVAQDTDTDGRLDTEWQYRRGEIITAQRDTDGDGKVDVWNAYENGRPVRVQLDQNGDGQPDAEVTYDADGNPQQRSLANAAPGEAAFGAGLSVAASAPTEGAPSGADRVLRQDRNDDGRPDVTTWISAGVRRRQAQDTNFDGRDDLFFTFDEKGLLAKAEVDTRHDGKIHLIRTYADEAPFEDRLDSDNDGHLDTVVSYEAGRMVRQTRDNNRDGKPDLHFWFDRDGQRRKVESDSDTDGRIDTRYLYAGGTLQQMERDGDGNGITELRLLYRHNEKRKLLSDQDQDGYFETIQWYAVAGWEQVVEVDQNRDGMAETRIYYLDNRTVRRDLDRNSDGRLERVEWFDPAGGVNDHRDWTAGAGAVNIIWPVGDDGRPFTKTRDENANGHPDIWEHFSNQRLVARMADRNHDGRPDLWELYAPAAEGSALIEKRLDEDFDGIPDVSSLP